MAHNEIEVMIYGENVADLRPAIPSEDVTLRKVIQVENPNYLFLQININEQAKDLQMATLRTMIFRR